MKKIYIALMLVILSAVSLAQVNSKPEPMTIEPYASSGATTGTVKVSAITMEQAIIYNEGPKLIEVKDEKGNVILTVMRDGSVISKDPTKIDDAAKLFWKLMAKYMPEFCKGQL